MVVMANNKILMYLGLVFLVGCTSTPVVERNITFQEIRGKCLVTGNGVQIRVDCGVDRQHLKQVADLLRNNDLECRKVP